MSSLVYDPNVIEAELRRHPLRSLWRFLRLVAIALSYFLRTWLERQRWSPSDPRANAIRFREQLVALGPTFIKIGQLLSTRPDLMPLDYVHELAVLQDRVPPFDTEVAIRIVRAELGSSPADLFAAFDPVPLSAASIGQVYRARLKTGEEVVVKIQRPDLEERIALDLAVLRRIAQWAERARLPESVPVSKDMPYVAILDRFGQSLYDQLDFIGEGRNAETFNSNFAGFPGVSAPKVYWEFTSRRVITQEYIEGFKFNQVEQIRAAGIDFEGVASLGVRAFVKQVLEDGFFHADTHPGNVLVRPNGDVVYIDFGMVDTLEPALQQQLVDVFLDLVEQNYDAFIDDLIGLEFLPPAVDRSRIRPLIEDIYATQLGFRGRLYSMAEIIDKLGTVLYDYPFYMPEKFAFLMRAVATMEGVVLDANPHFKFIEVALPFAGKLLLKAEKKAIRERLIQRITVGGELRLDRLLEIYEYATREPTFRVGEVVRPAVEYLLSEEAKGLREKLAVALLSPSTGAQASFQLILERTMADPSLDPADVVDPALEFLVTSDGAELLDKVLPALDDVEADSPVMQAVTELADRYGEVYGYDALLERVLPLLRIVTYDRSLDLRPLGRLLVRILESESGRHWLAGWATRLDQVYPTVRGDLVALALVILDHPGLDSTPLIRAGLNFMVTPEGEPWRQLLVRMLANGELRGPAIEVFQRSIHDEGLRNEVLAAILPSLRFLASPEAAGTWTAFGGLLWNHVGSWVNGRSPLRWLMARPALPEPQGD